MMSRAPTQKLPTLRSLRDRYGCDDGFAGPILGLLLSLLALATRAQPAVAQAADVTAERLKVVLVASSAKAESLRVDDFWEDACAALGSAFRAGSGPWGLGLFTGHDCATAPTENAAAEESDWTLLVVPKGKTVALRLRYRRSKGDLGVATIPTGKLGLELLTAKRLALKAAGVILSQLPVAGRVPQKLRDLEFPATRDDDPQALPPPPKALDAFTLTYDPERGYWQPRLVTTASLVDKGEKGGLVWRLAAAPATGVVWLQDSVGPRARTKELRDHMLATAKRYQAHPEEFRPPGAIARVSAAAISSVGKGVVGLRYGQALYGEGVIRKLSILSFLVELRGAPLDGLRFYYDTWPSKNYTVATGLSHASGQRAVLGWSLALPKSWYGPFDRLDVVPKIGRWSMHLDYSFLADDGSKFLVPFEMKGALSLGGELGMERHFGESLLRAWAGFDFGNNPLLKGQKTSVANTRAGLDALISGPDLGPVNLSALLFVLYESESLSLKGTDDSLAVAVTSISFATTYLGVGLALSW